MGVHHASVHVEVRIGDDHFVVPLLLLLLFFHQILIFCVYCSLSENRLEVAALRECMLEALGACDEYSFAVVLRAIHLLVKQSFSVRTLLSIRDA